MADIEVYRYSDDSKLFTFLYCASGFGLNLKKAISPYWIGYRDVLPRIVDDSNVDVRVPMSGVLIDKAGAVTAGLGSLDDQIAQLYSILTTEFEALYVRVYWSGASDYTDYAGHFSFINSKVGKYNNWATFNAEFIVGEEYQRV